MSEAVVPPDFKVFPIERGFEAAYRSVECRPIVAVAEFNNKIIACVLNDQGDLIYAYSSDGFVKVRPVK